MDDNGLPNNISGQQSPPKADQPMAEGISDQSVLPPLPVPGDTVPPAVSDTVTQESTVTQVTPSPTEPEKPKKKSNMKVVAGLMVALFLVGAAITASVMFPAFRGDLRQRASETASEGGGSGENSEGGMRACSGSCTSGSLCGTYNDLCYCENLGPCGGGGDDNPVPTNPPASGGGGGCNQEPIRCWDGSEVNGCTGSCPSQGSGGPPPGDHGAPDAGGGCNQEPIRCWDGSEVNGCTGSCPSQGSGGPPPGDHGAPDSGGGGGPSGGPGAPGVGGNGGGPTATVTSTVTSTPGAGGGGTCEGAQNASCCAGKSPGQVTCGGSVGYCTRGTSGCSFDFAKICIPNECYHTGTGDEGRLCASDGLGYVANTTCYANPTVWTCGCDLGDEAGSVGPQTCWNKETGGSVKKEPFISGCKGSGAPSVTTSVTTTATATVTTTPGGGSSSGGSSSSSSGGSSSSSSGGTAPLCVETRVYLKKADGAFDTVATPVSQLSSKVSIGNTIRLAIRGNLANFTKGRFIIKKDGTVLETKETTTKNNLPGDPATFEYIYDYTVASGGSYSIEGAVWQ